MGELTFGRGKTTFSWGGTTWGETDLGQNDCNSVGCNHTIEYAIIFLYWAIPLFICSPVIEVLVKQRGGRGGGCLNSVLTGTNFVSEGVRMLAL